MGRRKLFLLRIVYILLLISLIGCQKQGEAEEQNGVQWEEHYLTEEAERAKNTTTEDDREQNEVQPIEGAEENKLSYQISIDAGIQGITISPDLYGLFFEDINFAADGGLYAEMVKNRSFEYEDGYAENGPLHGYTRYGECYLNVLDDDPLNRNNPHYIRIKNDSGKIAGITNKGYLDGMSVKEGEDYLFTVYLRSTSYSGNIKVYLQSIDGEILAEGTIQTIGSEFQKYEVRLTARADANPAMLTLAMTEDGIVEADMISLFPYNTYLNRENGLRADLVELLKELNPSFLRFPGGCVVEGNPLANAYRWKDTIGDVAERKQNRNLWTGDTKNPYYQSYGLGFYEYFLLCEDLGCIPVPVLNCGISCQVRGNQYSVYASEAEFHTYIQDALDLIEFCNGDGTTVWGSKRIQMGHKEPFGLVYVAIGNEQWGTTYFSYYEAFQKAISAKYPDIKLITTAGTSSSGDSFEYAWNKIKIHKADVVPYAALIDEHYYNTPEWFLSNVKRYDSYDRDSCDVFLGEYAAKSNTLSAAIAEAAYMTGLEENSDVVKMAAYAPLFGNLNSYQWSPDLIWFNNELAFGSVNYYVQQMFSQNRGDYIIPSVLEGSTKTNQLTGQVGIGTWKTSASFDDICIASNDTGDIIYQTSFDQLDDGWSYSSQGNFKQTDDEGNIVYTQLNDIYPTNEAIMGSAAYIGSRDLSNYTLTMKAKKVSGDEGFLIPFAVKDSNNFYHWNIGGWGNTVSAIEHAEGGVKTTVTENHALRIMNGIWYEIRLVVTETHVECYINDELIHSMDVDNILPVYETASFDQETGEIILKIVNSLNEEANVGISIKNAVIHGEAKKIVLMGERKDAVNSIFNTQNVRPETSSIPVEDEFSYSAPPLSVTIIRIPKY
ncbi:MAG: alpha-N-arabinofuranosidase [Lachnospiraceae bacterium]|nr:alpha-N-arabinofuranosidase [Lachnospiraceae bacterium]